MPVYHFHAYDADVAHERESYELPDLDGARTAAIAFAGRKLPALGHHLFQRDLRLEVTNDSGLVLLSIMVVGLDMTSARRHSG